MWILIYIFLILCSIAYVPGVRDEFWIVKNAIYVLGGISVIAVSMFFKKRTLTFGNKWIGMALIYSILSFGWFFFVPLIYPNAKGNVLWNVWNYLPTLNFIVGIFFIKTIYESTDSLKPLVNLGKILCWLGFSFSVLAILQYYKLDQIFVTNPNFYIKTQPSPMSNGDTINTVIKNSQIVTFIGNAFLSGNFIAVTAPMALMFNQFRYKIIYVIALFSLVLIGSALSMAAFIISSILFFLLTRKMKSFFILTGLCLMAIIYIQIYNPAYLEFSGRENAWAMFWESCKQKFYTGYGLGSFAHKNYVN